MSATIQPACYRCQLAHWTLAIERLADLDDIASPASWLELERHVGVVLRSVLAGAVGRLRERAAQAARVLQRGPQGMAEAALQDLRNAYLRTEVTLDFFADAINTRTSPRMSRLLAAADALAGQSMTMALNPLGQQVPPVLAYLDKGIGASILRHGLRLWDRTTENPVAAIKVGRHNLLRPTSLIHETGHQVAHIVGWNEELARAVAAALPGRVGEVWSAWASEIAADAFAFVHTGYASVAALHDVLDGGEGAVFRFLPGDPHPIGYLRVLLGVAMARLAYADGPWDALAAAWRERYPLSRAPSDLTDFLKESVAVLDRIAATSLIRRHRAFRGLSLSGLVDPLRVSPQALGRLEQEAGAALYTSGYWLRREALRLLALTGYRFATRPDQGRAEMERQMEWMLRLGASEAADLRDGRRAA